MSSRSIDIAIRSMFQMIVLIDDGTCKCTIIDHNPELANIMPDKASEKKKLDHEVFLRSFDRNIHPEDREDFAAFMDPQTFVAHLKKHVYVSMECRIRHANRKYYWSEVTLCNTTEEDSTVGNAALFLIKDIHVRKTRELKREAEERRLFNNLKDKYDALFEENMKDYQTGCYNRKGMKYYSDIVIDEAKKTGKFLFVCVADLNGLKHLNDTYGHAAGDEAIAAVSTELLKASPTGTRIVRTGGDEFLLFAALDKDSTEPDEMGAKVDKGLADYNRDHPNPYEVGVSYGWIFQPVSDDLLCFDELIEIADYKMYEMRLTRDKYRRD